MNGAAEEAEANPKPGLPGQRGRRRRSGGREEGFSPSFVRSTRAMPRGLRRRGFPLHTETHARIAGVVIHLAPGGWKETDRWMDGWIGWMDGMDGWMDGMDGMDG